MREIRITMKSGLVIGIDAKYIVTAVTEDDDVVKVELMKEKKNENKKRVR